MIIVTGAKGFLGSYVMAELEGMNPISIEDVSFGYRSYTGRRFDIRDPDAFESLPALGVEAIVHCAALLMIDGHPPADYFQTNSVGTFNLLEYSRKIGATLIYAMTHSDVNASPDMIIREDTPRCFTTNSYGQNSIPFIASKIAAMEMIEAYNRSESIKGIIFRIASMRGCGTRDTQYNSPFHQFIAKARKGEDIELWGELKTQRDLVYVRDVARAVRMAIIASRSREIRGLYNIGSGKGLTIREEAEAIINVFSEPGKRSRLIYRPDIPEVRKHSCIFDISKARKDLGWVPVYSYENGLLDMRAEIEKEDDYAD